MPFFLIFPKKRFVFFKFSVKITVSYCNSLLKRAIIYPSIIGKAYKRSVGFSKNYAGHNENGKLDGRKSGLSACFSFCIHRIEQGEKELKKEGWWQRR